MSVYLLHLKDEDLDKFKIYKQVELHKNELIKVLILTEVVSSMI